MQKRHPVLPDTVSHDGVVGISRHEQHARVRALSDHSVGQLASPEEGHDDVGDQQMDFTVEGGADVQSFDAVGGLQHLVAARFQSSPGEQPHALFVLDQQDGFGSAPDFSQRLLRLRRAGSRLGSRQVDSCGGACTQGTLHVDETGALFDNSVHRGQAQPGALVLRFGRKKRLEHPNSRGLVHANPRVGDREHHILSGLHPGMFSQRIGVEQDIGGANGQSASGGHGVAAIDHQVHDGLFELTGVRLDGGQLRVERCRQIDVFADQPTDHLFEIADQAVQVQLDRGQDLLAAEGQQLPRQIAGALARPVDIHEDRILGVGIEPDFTQAEDNREQIVEVVGDAAGQLPYGVHLLRLQQLSLEPLAVGHVAEDR